MNNIPETEYAKYLYMNGYLLGPKICKCGWNLSRYKFLLQIKHMDTGSDVQITNA